MLFVFSSSRQFGLLMLLVLWCDVHSARTNKTAAVVEVPPSLFRALASVAADSRGASRWSKYHGPADDEAFFELNAANFPVESMKSALLPFVYFNPVGL